MIKLVEYDDQTSPAEAIKNIERLAAQDKVDFILAPYGTGFNIATASVFHKYGYPQLTSTAITDKVAELTAQYPGMFFTLSDTTTFSTAVSRRTRGLALLCTRPIRYSSKRLRPWAPSIARP